jgi:hypothetical protein
MNDEMKESQDSKTHKVAPTRPCQCWQEFFDLAARIRVPEDFLADREDAAPQRRRQF